MITLLLAKTTLVLLLGISVAALLRHRSSATRHFAWTLTLFATALVAVAALVAPPVQVPVSYVPDSVTVDGGRTPRPAVETIANLPATSDAPPVQAAHTPAFRISAQAVWLAGFAGVLVWFAIGHIGIARLSRTAKLANDDWIVETAGDRNARVAFSAAVTTPVTWGSLILFPFDAASWPPERRRAALLHELAHVVRRDSLTQIIASVICAAYWFHPLVWIAMRRLRIESELACDDFVLSGGAEAPEYASHLVDVARIARGRRWITDATLDMARPSQLEGRVVAVLDGSRKRTLLSGAGARHVVCRRAPTPRALRRGTARVACGAGNVVADRFDDVVVQAGASLDGGDLRGLARATTAARSGNRGERRHSGLGRAPRSRAVAARRTRLARRSCRFRAR